MIVPVAAVLVGTGVFGAALGLGMLVLFAAATSSGCGFLEARSAV